MVTDGPMFRLFVAPGKLICDTQVDVSKMKILNERYFIFLIQFDHECVLDPNREN